MAGFPHKHLSAAGQQDVYCSSPVPGTISFYENIIFFLKIFCTLKRLNPGK
jgi:hypothetical protein